MSQRTTFRFAAGEISFELSGSEDFVRRQLANFLPFVERVVGKPTGSPVAREARAVPDLATWLESHAGGGSTLSRQDSILAFALWMRSFKKYIFTSEDIRRGFEEIGQPEPKSLLQILGTLKRDHNLILGTERRGEYMLNTSGVERARRILGIPTRETSGASAALERPGTRP